MAGWKEGRKEGGGRRKDGKNVVEDEGKEGRKEGREEEEEGRKEGKTDGRKEEKLTTRSRG
jgi:hypothetical protein